jgi:hypothetical protein
LLAELASIFPNHPLLANSSDIPGALLSRVKWPFFMAEIIGPQSVPKKFDRFPKGMAVRRASATNPLS